jgi:hypothetical protein
LVLPDLPLVFHRRCEHRAVCEGGGRQWMGFRIVGALANNAQDSGWTACRPSEQSAIDGLSVECK